MSKVELFLTEEQIQEIVDMPWHKRDSWRGDFTALANTIKEYEKEIKSVKALKNYIDPGILINDNLILSTEPPDEVGRYGINLTALNPHSMNGGVLVRVGLTRAQAERLVRLLPEAIKAKKYANAIHNMKKILEARKSGRRW